MNFWRITIVLHNLDTKKDLIKALIDRGFHLNTTLGDFYSDFKKLKGIFQEGRLLTNCL